MTWVYNTPRWRTLRATILGYRQNCTCGKPTTTVHHIEPVTGADDPRAWDPANLEAMCLRCYMDTDGARQGTVTDRTPRHAV